MRLIVGLGNPGVKYINNRHNVGYMAVDELKAERLRLKGTVIKKTDVFMNDSGEAVKKFYAKYLTQNTDLYVVHDDLDIRLGEYKIQFGKGPKDHKGLNSIYKELGTHDFWHVRIGVDNRGANDELRTEGEEYVLQDFSEEERKIVNLVIEKLIENLKFKIKN